MRRSLTLALAVISCASIVVSAHAGPNDGFWASVGRDYHRNKCWPVPFVHYDRESAYAPYGPMISKGWERQNLLSDHHFEADGKTMSQAGQLKVRWILTQAPAQNRTIFVQRSTTAELTGVRVDTVQHLATTILTAGDLPQVTVSSMDDPGHPADYIDSVGRKFNATTPDPRLPKATTASEGSSQ